MSRAALLVLADGRFPAGGHAHSGGAEAAVKAGRITGAQSLESFCRGRLHTAGLVSAALAAAAVLGVPPAELDAAADARTPSPALRVAARKLGRQLTRAARATCTKIPNSTRWHGSSRKGAHQPVVLGLAARAAGLEPLDAAYCAAYESVSGPASATVRLLSLDPFDATGVLARLTQDLDRVADLAVEAARKVADEGTDALPAASAPLLEIAAELHAAWPVRLFAS
ncbi:MULTISPECIES: urease accessory UreF family protein [Streptomyces]|uniref:Urease accessory protein UreF n=1 Tax=Streptomyces sviceus (strain ATCC 29083 / DSM 924 / JCM 4929 / NBRC 13980 / NCIMB 11184 / NRRL 5439 / UC 5370) TaxID=463191 RepID=B5HZN5_STRX2|nr:MULTISPECIES: urease accessory UreF family protein [Streptomyces]EDY58290.2 urease accessory protein [Streptomyces sviceus ATCC 29083]MYT04278.1 urease accessory protein UreF [Streptomyces sp. SID5470]